MGQLTDANVRDIVRSEVHSAMGDIKRDLAKIESRLHDLQAMQSDVQRTLHDVGALASQTKGLSNLSATLSQINFAVDEMRARVKRAEETSRYTAGYVAMRLKERYDKQY